MLHVLIADEEARTRAELQRAVENVAEAFGDECVVAQTDEGVTTFRKAKRVQPDLVLISASLPLGGGVQVVQALQLYSPRAKIVVLSSPRESPQSLLAFVQAGVHGVLPRHQEALARELSIGRILRGERYFAADGCRPGAGL
jgi:DNA-binding NarL/FixJ family response regulator